MVQTAFYFAEKGGPHAVGLKVVEQFDRSRVYRSAVDELGRPFSGERARPLQTLVWYPSVQSNAKAMTVGDYLELWRTERSFGHPTTSARAEQWRSGLKLHLSDGLWAVRDAPPESGRFPIIVYTPGHSDPAWDNADLCEYLASHGYVVVATPSIGKTTRYPTLNQAGIDPGARDISFLIGFAQSLPNTDASQVAAIGFSWGGICNVFAAARDDRIKALVTLDGSLRFSPGLVRQAGDVVPERMTIPLLSIAQGQWSPEEKAMILDANPGHEGPDVLNGWIHGDLVTVHLLGFGHGEHSSMVQRNEDEWPLALEFYKHRKVDYGREDSILGYGWLARYTLHFLNAYLKDDAGAMSFLRKTPVENGAPFRFMTVDFRPAQRAFGSFESFRRELNEQGFERAAEVYAQIRKHTPAFELDELTLDNWADELIDGGRLTEAGIVLELNVAIHPESGGAHLRLGDFHERRGRTQAAIAEYQIASGQKPIWLALRARARLQALGCAPYVDE